jgi:hypothetical protein
MAETTMMLSSEQHQQCAKALFNTVWTFLEMKDRSVDDDDLMVHTAHASLLHWLQVGTARNFARGEWQLSRVYAVLNRAEPALHHADRCLALCRDHDLGDFDLGFAYEAHARAHAVAGNEAGMNRFLELAEQVGRGVDDEEDRKILSGDLQTVRLSADET